MFITLARELLNRYDGTSDEYVFDNFGLNGDIGFTFRRNYSGTMAGNPVKRAKQGLFDIHVDTGTRYPGVSASHRMVFDDIIVNTTESKCLEIWRGADPRRVGQSPNERELLAILMLFMFEQEINWGGEAWQKYSFFPPKITIPAAQRPRDMLMGYIRQAFAVGVENLKYWRRISGEQTPTFTNRDENSYDFISYPATHKQYFTQLAALNGTDALMVGSYRSNTVPLTLRAEFRSRATAAQNNPRFVP